MHAFHPASRPTDHLRDSRLRICQTVDCKLGRPACNPSASKRSVRAPWWFLAAHIPLLALLGGCPRMWQSPSAVSRFTFLVDEVRKSAIACEGAIGDQFIHQGLVLLIEFHHLGPLSPRDS